MEPVTVSLALSAVIHLFKSNAAQTAMGHVGDAILTSGVLPDAIKTAYQGLKDMIGRKAPESRLVNSIERAEKAEPEDTDRIQIMSDKIARSPIAADTEILEAAKQLLDLVKAQPGGPDLVATVTQTVTGNNNTVIGVIKGDYNG